MQELEIEVLSSQRQGLLIDLGKVIISHGYALLRQRMVQAAQGVQLTLIVRGPADRQLELEDALNAHPRVIGIETGRHQGGRIDTNSSFAGTPSSGTPESAVAEATATTMTVDSARVEAVLPMIAREYPRIFARLQAMERDLDKDSRIGTLRQAGVRTGAWVFKRDFSLGGRLPLAEALKRIVVPALRNLVDVEIRDERVRVRNSPLCQPGQNHGPTCHFFCGYLEGLLVEADTAPVINVREIYCRSTGADACVFDVSV